MYAAFETRVSSIPGLWQVVQDPPTRKGERRNIVSIRPTKSARALTLVEVMLSTVILGIAAMGALSFEYHAAGHAKIAHAQICGTRIARLLLEDWMSTGGAIDYDPTALDVGFSQDGDAYAITVDGVPMLAALAWRDVGYDATAEVTLRRLDVTITFGENSNSAGDGKLKKVRPVILTTYVRTDASGG